MKVYESFEDFKKVYSISVESSKGVFATLGVNTTI